MQSLRFRTNQNDAKWRRAVAQHEQMLAALTARDAAALGRVLVEHLHDKLGTVLELLRASEIYPAVKKASEPVKHSATPARAPECLTGSEP